MVQGHLGLVKTKSIPASSAYYLPPASVRVPLTPTRRRTFCEWKGWATYYAIAEPTSTSTSTAASTATSTPTSPAGASSTRVADRIWSYDDPKPPFGPLRDHLAFYAGPWDCYVDGELVVPQPGDFYGGWVTDDIEGIVKGRRGNLDPET